MRTGRSPRWHAAKPTENTGANRAGVPTRTTLQDPCFPRASTSNFQILLIR